MFQLAELKVAFVAAGKKLLAPSVEVIKSFGTVGVSDPQFAGRRKGDNGEYILMRDSTTQELLIIGLPNGTPASANAFEIKQLRQLEDYGEVKAGAVFFKAYGIINEVEA